MPFICQYTKRTHRPTHLRIKQDKCNKHLYTNVHTHPRDRTHIYTRYHNAFSHKHTHWPSGFYLQVWIDDDHHHAVGSPVSSSSCERAVLLVKSSFSRDRSRKRHEKRAVGCSLLHNLVILASMVRTATLNMQLGSLRDQQQLWENCFLKMLVRRRLWKDATPLKRRKQNVRARKARLGSKRGCHGAGWCLPVHVRSLEPSAAKRLWNGQARLRAAKCTRWCAGHLAEVLCEVATGCPGACRPVRPRCSPIARPSSHTNCGWNEGPRIDCGRLTQIWAQQDKLRVLTVTQLDVPWVDWDLQDGVPSRPGQYTGC